MVSSVNAAQRSFSSGLFILKREELYLFEASSFIPAISGGTEEFVSAAELRSSLAVGGSRGLSRGKDALG